VQALVADGHRTFIEISPHPVLTFPVQDTVPDGHVQGTLRRDHDDTRQFTDALARLHVIGRPVAWDGAEPGHAEPGHAEPGHAELNGADLALPTYPFERTRYWLAAKPGGHQTAGDGHPLAPSATEHPTTGGSLHTGRIGPDSHPWTADHAVSGTVLLPGAALVDLVARLGPVAELTLEEPLVLDTTRTLRMVVDPGETGDSVALYSREGDGEWTRHAVGLLADTATAPDTEWAPSGEAVDISDAYERLADAGYEYGPVFQGLRSLREDGDDRYAEVALPDDVPVDGYGVHPALFDAALHAAVVGRDRVVLPFAWQGVRVHTTGARTLGVRVRTTGQDTVSVVAVDPAGRAVFSVDSLTLRPARTGGGATRDVAYRTEWVAVRADTAEVPAYEVLEFAPPSVEAMPDALAEVLRAVRERIADETTVDTRLVVRTRDAFADPASAPVWGLLRSAQTEHPDRFVLLDTDGDPASDAALPAALATGEPQLALRGGAVLAPRLVRTRTRRPTWTPGDGTVLVTGGTGALGAAVARHLVSAHGVGHLLLVSRSGGAEDLVADLTRAGARVTVAACDVADRDRLAAVLADIPAEHPLVGVVHAAGVLDDATVAAMGEDALRRVLSAKATSAWHLHELTATLDLSAFVLFSSLAGQLGNAGQGNYAAANVFLDALARHRRDGGQAASSVAWGLWRQDSGMTAGLTDADVARLARSGVRSLTDEQGLALFDAALAGEDLVGAALVPSTLRDLRSAGALAPVLRELVPAVRRRSEPSQPWADRLAELSPTRQREVLLGLVRTAAAEVLAFPGPDAVTPDRPLLDLGFDSLTAMQLRNRLAADTGLRLPSTLVFDQPTATAIVDYLSLELIPTPPTPEELVLAEITRLEAVLADTATRAAATHHLRRLLSRVDDADAPVLDRFDSATDEEIFALLDNEL
jgi:pimaricinolide synthase PimS1